MEGNAFWDGTAVGACGGVPAVSNVFGVLGNFWKKAKLMLKHRKRKLIGICLTACSYETRKSILAFFPFKPCLFVSLITAYQSVGEQVAFTAGVPCSSQPLNRDQDLR